MDDKLEALSLKKYTTKENGIHIVLLKRVTA